MFLLEDVKDLICSVAAAVTKRITVAKRKSRNPLANPTNIYRCEDGRPISFWCLRVGHVAKYCWDRRFSCCHAPFANQPAPEQSSASAPIDVESLGTDVNKLLNEFHKITHDLELLNTAPFHAEDLRCTTDRTVVRSEGTEKTPQCLTMEKGKITAEK